MIYCSELLENFNEYLIDSYKVFEKIKDPQIYDVSDNSKKIKNKGIFFAINSKALTYLDEVIQIGVRCVIVDLSLRNDDVIKRCLENPEHKIIFCHNIEIRRLYALIVSRFYNLSSYELKIIAITGTNGKSSSTFFYKQLCSFAGLRACSIGTIGIYSDDAKKYENSSLTSPNASDISKILYEKASSGIFDFAIEASSHGLDQYRLDGIPLEAVAFTNFSHDHLDYHENIENYWKAKKRLFEDLIMPDKKIVVNNDDKKSFEIKKICLNRGIQYITFGIKNESDVQILSHQLEKNYKQYVEMKVFEKKYFFNINILGEFQLYNIATAVALFCCVHPDKIDFLFCEDGNGDLQKLEAPPGRMESINIDNDNNTLVIIDYAHTPDALENLLITTRKLLNQSEKLLLVFGCGGNRDKEKRSIMGQIAEKYADFIILTDDNPRDEDADTIRSSILAGIINQEKVRQIKDREEAIRNSIESTHKIIVIAGKGHENTQIFKDHTINFSDRDVVQKINLRYRSNKQDTNNENVSQIQ